VTLIACFQHALIRDEDGTFLGSPEAGAIISRAEVFSENSFFGLPYNDPVNRPNATFWYPNLPAAMRSDRSGRLLNLTEAWLLGGWGIPRAGCTLMPAWNAWKCSQASGSYRMLTIENMDADSEIRRISPVAVSSDDGYTDLLNGCMDKGWWVRSVQHRLLIMSQR
jgi:hypothetical protein